ncbi:cbb3-type cytochrome oxidase subunit 3 [Pelagimonas varians]|uniref:Cbb3-type cytochrome oxidase component FixQ n=1 Tax=Pelagimonas varians TaxID=696760 RepID=A0A238K5C8_9RHOB|nr:cbb3-type cytochrome c oxidase subunit 3 [Pelagimonas varians]PYG27021.1 cytochrome c oxidase cbb3-type subunit 4 [Pelagimonas varians]SMX37136.1 Cbb3-type cytochrome oxidase component FixQ [Pelagimonas varians]
MESYSLLRELADSWALLAMFSVFVGIVLWAFRPGSRAMHNDTANIPFRHDDKPLASVSGDPATSKEARKT